MTTPLQIANQFFELTDPHGREIAALLPAIGQLLTDDFKFVGPLMKVEGKEAYLGLLGQFLQAHIGYAFHKQFESGNDVCSIYDMTVGTPDGKTITMSLADWLKFRDGKICEQAIFYDPREFAAAFGM